MTLSLTLLDQTFTIHRLSADAEIPPQALRSPFFAITRTDDELSLVLPASVEIARPDVSHRRARGTTPQACGANGGRRARESEKSEAGWACFKVEGPLEFGLVGVLAGITRELAVAGVSIFALSTFDTDYILVKREQVRAAREALVSSGYNIKGA
jgi:hypothetical protein